MPLYHCRLINFTNAITLQLPLRRRHRHRHPTCVCECVCEWGATSRAAPAVLTAGSFVVVLLTTKNSPPCLRPGGMIDQNTESIENSNGQSCHRLTDSPTAPTAPPPRRPAWPATRKPAPIMPPHPLPPARTAEPALHTHSGAHRISP
jgi:hypothetical protein